MGGPPREGDNSSRLKSGPLGRDFAEQKPTGQ
jgi:hypothetical protein